MSATGKKTGQICLREKTSVSDLESSSLAGFFALIWSNLCTRHILFGLKPRGHHDWPYKGVLRPSGICSTRAEVRSQSTDQLLRTYCLSVKQAAIQFDQALEAKA